VTQPEPTKRKVPIMLRFSQLWLVGIMLLLGLDWFSQSFDPGWLTRGHFIATVVMSVVAFVYFGIDKRRANLDKHRISERQLHLLSLFGGWPGAVIGQQKFRHKTIKMSFRVVLCTIIACHVAVSGWFIYHGFTAHTAEPISEALVEPQPRLNAAAIVRLRW